MAHWPCCNGSSSLLNPYPPPPRGGDRTPSSLPRPLESPRSVESDEDPDIYDIMKHNGDVLHDRTNTESPRFQFKRHSATASPSSDPKDLCLNVETFCRAFPFHVVFDRTLEIKQCGVALLRVIKAYRKRHKTLNFKELFEVIRPTTDLTFESILERSNTVFVVTTASGVLDQGTPCQDENDVTMRLRGQMIFLESTDTILYLCSPRVQNLDDLKGRGLFLSDIPVHDATRDLILITQARKAERELVEKLEETSNNLRMLQTRLQEDKEMTDELLHSILPPQVAERLRLNQPVEADKYELVTVLYSDIVAFTSLCGNENIEAMDIVRLLNRLYTQFDMLCTQNDVYKMETIGDAYTIVGGLPEYVETHCDRVVTMAIGMIDVSKYNTLPDGTPIQIRIGIHSGPVLAGVVGKKMPRYCLFGDTVTIANKMEACSLPGKINISARAKKLMVCPMDFTFEENTTRPDLPEPCYLVTAQPNSPRHLSPSDFNLNLPLGLFRTPNPSPTGTPRSASPCGSLLSGEASPTHCSSLMDSPAYPINTPTIKIDSDYDTTNILASMDAKMAHYNAMELQVRHTLNLASPDLFLKTDRKRRRTSLGNVIVHEPRDRGRRERSCSVSWTPIRADENDSTQNEYQLAALLGRKLRAYVEQTDTIIEAAQSGSIDIPTYNNRSERSVRGSTSSLVEEQRRSSVPETSPKGSEYSTGVPSPVHLTDLLRPDNEWKSRPSSLERIDEASTEVGGPTMLTTYRRTSPRSRGRRYSLPVEPTTLIVTVPRLVKPKVEETKPEAQVPKSDLESKPKVTEPKKSDNLLRVKPEQHSYRRSNSETRLSVKRDAQMNSEHSQRLDAKMANEIELFIRSPRMCRSANTSPCVARRDLPSSNSSICTTLMNNSVFPAKNSPERKPRASQRGPVPSRADNVNKRC